MPLGPIPAHAVVTAAVLAILGQFGSVAASPLSAFDNPPEIGRSGSHISDPMATYPLDVSVELSVEYRDGALWNPETGQYDNVRLRSYVSGDATPDAFVGPTIIARPGDTLRVHLENNLPEDDPSCADYPDNINVPHCFNSTNLHAHGFWVSPGGNSDNIFLTFKPGMQFEHEYAIPADHPAGTFWYHPHLHGSTALQVSSGMGGALILRGDRMPTADANGDLDVLLRPTPDQPFQERVILFQQLAYACRDETGRIKTTPADDDQGRWVCNDTDIGEVERYLGPVPPNQFGGGVWNHSGRYTSINGAVLPVIYGGQAGHFERWRMVHAGVRDTVSLEVRKLEDSYGPLPDLAESGLPGTLEEHCTGEPVPMHLVAADGLTMDQALIRKRTVLQPGYRWDALIAFPEPGRYCLIDEIHPPGGGLDSADLHPAELMGVIIVGEGPGFEGSADEALTAALVSAAQRNIDDPVLSSVVKDLEDGLHLTAFAAHGDLMGADVSDTQEVVFNIDITTDPVRYEINGEVFDPTNVRRVPLGAVQDWVISSTWEGHPYHIHVNPFQVIEVLDPNGRDVSAPGAVDDFTGEIDTQFSGLKGVWKDTIWIKNPQKSPDQAYTIRVRTRYDRYIGKFVIHCHILDHEDQGMMEIIEIVLPDGLGGMAEDGHGQDHD